MFVLTWDPLEWLRDRSRAWATASGDGDVLELVVYIMHDEIERRSQGSGDPAAAIGPLAHAVVANGARHEELLVSGAYAGLTARGRVDGLLAAAPDECQPVSPSVELGSGAWEPIGLGAIQDLVQDAFGPVDFDRSKVAFDAEAVPRRDCPACTGHSFGFPGELEEKRPAMCEGHRERAAAVTAARIARARASNPGGWRALGTASARLHDLPDPGPLPIPARRSHKSGRNEPCPCGSGRRYKRCCGG